MSLGVRQPRNFSMEALWELYRLQREKIIGDIFFVDAFAGLNTYDGLSRSSPVQTIAYALDQCVDDHDDYIICMDTWQQDTFPINVNKSRVHILGAGHWGGMYPRMAPTEDTAIFTISTKGYIEIGNFSLGAGATHASIEFISATSEGRSWLHDVWFGHTETGQDGIKSTIGESPEHLIERCVFGKLLTRDGIRLEAVSTRTIIRENLFRLVPGVGIDVVAINTDLGAILDNRFSLEAQAAQGAAITIAAGAVGCMVDGNKAMEAGAATTNNPYEDAGACDWGVNWRGNVVTYPV